MHAIRQHEFGDADQLRFEEVPDPEPGEGQVRIAVESAGVHLIDTMIRSGRPGPFQPPQLPMTPGREVAGVVDRLGDGVDRRWLGRRVVAHLGLASGGYAGLAVAATGALHEQPDGLDADAAVAMIGTGRTTLAVLELAQPGPDDVVLVTAAAGGIGSLLVQAAIEAGASVVGAAGGPAKAALVGGLGGDAVDYAEPDWPDAVRKAVGDRGVTLALDGVGGTLGRSAFELVEPGGRLVLYGGASGSWTELSTMDLLRSGVTAAVAIGGRLSRLPDGLRRWETEALARAADGRFVPVIGQRFALADAAAAHRAMETRATTGKTVLRP